MKTKGPKKASKPSSSTATRTPKTKVSRTGKKKPEKEPAVKPAKKKATPPKPPKKKPEEPIPRKETKTPTKPKTKKESKPKTKPAPKPKPKAKPAPEPTPPKPKRTGPPPDPISTVLKEEIRTVLVTGASSSVGNYLVQHLLRAGYSVIATDKRGSDVPGPTGKKPLTVKLGHISSSKFLSSCLEGTDAVFHAAGPGESPPSLEDQCHQTVRTLYEEARRKGVKRLIYVSSGFLYRRPPGTISEEIPVDARTERDRDWILAEKFLLTETPAGLPVVTVLRPGLVYGPRCRNFMGSIATLPPLVKTLGPYYIQLSSGPEMNLVHGEDVARAAIFLLLHTGAYRGLFNVADNNPMILGEFVNIAMEHYGLKPLGTGISYPPSTLLGSILPYVRQEEIFSPLNNMGSILWSRIERKHGLKKALSPSTGADPAIPGNRDLVLSNRKLLELGFKLKYPKFSRGWQNTVAWYQSQKWIPGPKDV